MLPQNGIIPPVPEGPIGSVLTVVAVPCFLGGFGLLSYFGFASLVAVFCALDPAPWVAIFLSVILALCVYGLVDEHELWPFVSLAAAFLSLTGAGAALFYGSGQGAAFGFFCSVLLLLPSIRAARKAGNNRFGQALLRVVSQVFALWIPCVIFLPGVAVMLGTALGLDIDPFHWEMVSESTFPYFRFECHASAGN